MQSERVSLFGNSSFLRLWAAGVTSGLAFSIAGLVEQWYVVNELKLQVSLGLVMIAGTLPRVLLMAVGGVFADRYCRLSIIVVSLALRALLIMAAAAIMAAGRFTLEWVIGFALFYGAIDAFFWPARDAALQDVVDTPQLTRANSILLTTNQLALVLGPLVGGLLIALLSYKTVFVLTGIGLGLSSLPLRAMRRRDAGKAHAHNEPLLKSLREGLNYVLATPVLRTLMGVQVFTNLLFGGPMLVGVPLIVANQLQGDARLFSYAQSTLAAGMILGGLAMAWRPPKKRRLAIMVAFIGLTGLLLVMLGQVRHWSSLIAVMGAIGICIAGNNVAMNTLIQEKTHKDKIGRVMALSTIAWMGLVPVSTALVSGLLWMGISMADILTTGGLGIAAICAASAWHVSANQKLTT